MSGNNATAEVRLCMSSASSPPSCFHADVLDAGATWRVLLPATAASTVAWELTVVQSDSKSYENVSLRDVLFGETILCSGQSNMAFLVKMAFQGPELVQQANNYPLMRLFTSFKINSSAPLREQPKVEQRWSVASNVSINMPTSGGANNDDWLYMSAVCWLYGIRIQESLGGDTPVGLINTNWGGTSIDSWSSSRAKAACSGSEPAAPSGGLWNGMMSPLLNFTFTSVLWYQGEADTGTSAQIHSSLCCGVCPELRH
jgi:sialate O-acetylesterase